MSSTSDGLVVSPSLVHKMRVPGLSKCGNQCSPFDAERDADKPKCTSCFAPEEIDSLPDSCRQVGRWDGPDDMHVHDVEDITQDPDRLCILCFGEEATFEELEAVVVGRKQHSHKYHDVGQLSEAQLDALAEVAR